MKIIVGLVQMEIFDGNKSKNTENTINSLKKLAYQPEIPDIVLLPELFTTGYDLRNVAEYAESIPGETTKRIAEISKGRFIVVGSILEVEHGKYYNTAFIMNKQGEILGKYRKVHLFSPMLETEFLTPGEGIKTFIMPELNDLRVGLAICYDIRFPELFRQMALEGADIIFLPSEFPSPKKDIWKTLIYARAIENQLFVIGVNRVGKGRSDEFFGCSVLTNGDYFINLTMEEEIKIFTLDLDTLKLIREKIPLLKDRRADIYRI